MAKAGYDTEQGSISTVYSSYDFFWSGGEEDGKWVCVHYTPIMQDGTVLSADDVYDYIAEAAHSGDALKSDAGSKRLIMNVEDVPVSEQEVDDFMRTGKASAGMESFMQKADKWGEDVHEAQADLYTDEGEIEYKPNWRNDSAKMYKQKPLKVLTNANICDRIRADWKEEDHPRDDDGKFTDGNTSEVENATVKKASVTGSNKLKVRGFKSKQHLNNHWKNGRTHKQEYIKEGITTAKQYEKRAVELAESAADGIKIMGYVTKEGYVCRYDVDKNDYVKADLEKGIRTMFKPESGMAYYEARKAVESDET